MIREWLISTERKCPQCLIGVPEFTNCINNIVSYACRECGAVIKENLNKKEDNVRVVTPPKKD